MTTSGTLPSGTLHNPTESEAETLQVFSAALETFCEKLPHDETLAFRKIRTLEDLEMAIQDIEKEQARRKSFRNLAKIRPFLRVLKQYTEVIDVLVSSKPDVLAFIWGPIKFCLQVALNFDRAFDVLLETYRKLNDSLPCVSAIETLFSAHPHVQIVLAHVYKDILTFHERASGGLTNMLRIAGWRIALLTTRNAFENLFEDVLRNLDRSKHLLLTSAHIAHFQEAQEHRCHIELEFQKQRRHENEQRKLAVIQWIEPPDHKNNHHEQKKRLVSGTTSWLFNEFTWKDWYCSTYKAAQLLWISGIPGAGKTVLFSSIVGRILDDNSRHWETAIAFFYCKYGDSARDKYENVAKSLIAQLLQDNQNCLDYLYDKALSSNHTHAETIEEYQEMIHAMIQCYKNIYIGIDGLDECEPTERKAILNLLHSFFEPSNSECQVKLFVSSRAEKDIEHSLRSAVRLELAAHYLENDIQVYVQERAKSMNEKFAFDNNFLQHIITTVVSQSAGMFLLSRLIMDTLQDLGTRGEVKDELEEGNLPVGIDQAYGRILKRVQGHKSKRNISRAKLILELLTSAQRTIELHEIQGVLSINLEKRDIDFENRAYMDHLKVLCGPILEITETGIVALVHTTAKQYLEGCTNDFITHASAQQVMARYCVNYLAFDCFKEGFSDLELTERVKRGEYGFQDYSVGYWMPHLMYMRAKTSDEYPDRSELLSDAQTLLASRYGSLSTLSTSVQEGDKVVQADTITWELLQRVQEKNLNIELGSSAGLEDEKPGSKGIAPFRTAMQVLSIIFTMTVADTVAEIFRQIHRTRAFIETTFESTTDQSDATNLRRAYGFGPFKCSVISCTRFHEGFPSREGRDTHYRKHSRPFKCTHDDCDYRTRGFSSARALTLHTTLDHNSSTLPHRFANMKIRSVWESLEDAIDQNDRSTVRELCVEVKDLPNKPTGFILRAARKNHVEVARVLVQNIGSFDEYYHKDKRGKIALFYASKNGHLELSQLLLAYTLADIKLLTKHYYSIQLAYRSAAFEGHLEVLRVWDKYIDIIPYSRNVVSVALSTAAHLGRTNVALFLQEKLIALSQQENGSPRELEYALNAAAAKGHKTTVRAMLEMSCSSDVPTNFSNPLKKALSRGLEAATAFVIARHDGSVDDKGKTSRNVLQAAAHKGKDDEIRRLLAQGADIDNADSAYGTALHAAARCGYKTTVRLLLNEGASVSAQGGTHGTCLAAAIAGNHQEVVSMLLEAGADINQGIGSGRMHNKPTKHVSTVLHDAIRNGFKELVSFLLANKADPEAIGVDGSTPITLAAQEGQGDVVSMLLAYGANINKVDGRKFTALLSAVSSGRGELVQLLIDQGAELETNMLDGEPLLHLASRNGHTEVVKLLLGYGEDPTKVNCSCETPLHLAAACDHEGIAHILLKYGAKLEAKDIHGQTPMYGVVVPGLFQMLRFLIKKGTDIQVKDNLGETILHKAAKHNSRKIVQILLENGADPQAANNNGYTPLDMSIQYCREDLVRLLIEKETNIQTTGWKLLHSAIYNGLEQIVQLLIEKGADIHQRSASRGYTLLHYAATNRQEKVMRVLLEGGMDVHSKTTDGDTALHWAVEMDTKITAPKMSTQKSKVIPTLELLYEYGADFNARHNAGRTALHRLWYMNKSERISNSIYYDMYAIPIAQTLLRCGANLDAEDHKGTTPRGIIVASVKKEVLKMNYYETAKHLDELLQYRTS
ncbi:hypothetical protein MMC17_005460 [Xylographa soralifera]|nr:hypothetical protein [Xylographa soralifera]